MLTNLPSITGIIAVFAFMAFLLVQKRRDIAVFSLLAGLAGFAALEILDLLCLYRTDDLRSLKKGALIAESLLPFCFLLFSLSFAREQAIRGFSWFSRVLLAGALSFPVFAALAPVERVFYSPDFAEERMLFLGPSGYFFYVGLMFYLAVALFHLERTLVALPRAVAWRIKLEIVGAGTVFGVLLLYYSQALLYRSLDMNLVPARSLLLALGVGMMGYSRLRRGEASAVRVSRDVAYRSLVVAAVGIYLVGLGLLGEGMRYLEFSAQRSVFVLVAVLAALAVLLVMLSERYRRKVKVFLHKHFYRAKFDYRKEWLRFTERLSSARSIVELQQAILGAYCETFAVQGALLFLADPEGERFEAVAGSQMGLPTRRFAGEGAFARHLADKDWVFNVADEHSAELADIEYFCREQGIELAVPLLFEKQLEGIVFLGQRINPGETLTYEDYDLMKVLAHQATSSLLSLHLSAQLSTAQEMAAMGKVSAFVMHDLKNLVSSLALVVDNAKSYLDDPEFQEDMLETLDGTVKKMKDLIARLKNMEGKSSLQLFPEDLLKTARDGIRLAGGDGIELSGEPVLTLIDAVEIQKVVLNLVVNAREACGGEVPVRVAVGSNGMGFVRVSDQGSGMSEEFIRTRLFRPFQTTKKKGFGIGLYQCRQVVEAHGGRIEVESREGEGAVFTVWVPLAEQELAAEGVEAV
ncbi:histidine kinase [Desulfuromonas versatilis]|uniref:histidine kinase n=1 Tax=Desulfuromonas versatilis TaxID=2802975 RepID=A0ABN6DYZ3_9BACT|nr:XrtA/PEP-CTERM system histidine kinase PrsK [Desulfuromonas versatilis]BCR05262.1 histidine kinase [Desulfuromonas versatilis]